MPRATSAPARHKRKKKLLKAAKGYFGGRKNLLRTVKDAVTRSWEHAYEDRRKKKRNFRRLWIARINAATREHDLSYPKFGAGRKGGRTPVPPEKPRGSAAMRHGAPSLSLPRPRPPHLRKPMSDIHPT